MAQTLEIAFTSSLQHILAELQRLDLLIRVQVWRLRQARKHEVNLSSLYIPEEEVDDILDGELGTPLWATLPLPPELLKEVQEQLVYQTAVIAQQKSATILPLRLDNLAQAFQLTPLDLDILLIALAPEIDLRYARLYGYLQDNVTHKLPSVNLCLSLLFPYIEDRLAAHERLTKAAPLRQQGLLHLGHPSTNPQPTWLDDGLTLDIRIVRYLLDGDDIDGRLSKVVALKSPTVAINSLLLPPNVAPRLISLTQQHDNLVLYFEGSYGVGKQTTASAICHELGRPLLVVNGEQLLKQSKAEQVAQLVKLIDREARLQEAAVFWESFDLLLEKEHADKLHHLLTMLAQRPGLTILSGNSPWEPASLIKPAPFVRVAFPVPQFDERTELWQTMLGEAREDVAALANKFRFSPGQIHDSVQTARNLARWRNPDNPQLETADLYEASRRHSNRKLAELAQKITPHYGWEDIVLPADRLEQLQEICDRVRHRGRVLKEWGFQQKLAMGKGTNALFAGPPGTGKTMAADIIAHDLGLDLYKIDLSTVVSKYIGETEKNLGKIFNEAETSNAILFFDEADALFGKRTEVRDSHDRYANLEISYLLQKMEEYEGVVILATNLHKNMDEAFRRRMHFIIEFPFPTAPDRQRIWEGIWPKDLPLAADMDLTFLAERVVVAGGNIRNIALAAAFLAAADGQTVMLTHLIKATQREYQKMGKLLTGKEFVISQNGKR